MRNAELSSKFGLGGDQIWAASMKVLLGERNDADMLNCCCRGGRGHGQSVSPPKFVFKHI